MMRTRLFLAIAAGLAMIAAGCGKSRKPILVGSKNSTEQMVVGEIVAQYLENRLKRPVERRLGMGATVIVYQALANGELTVYPEYSGVIESEILKEQPPQDTQMVFERARGEVARQFQLELLAPLGYENPPVIVVRSADATKAGVSTLSEAAESATPWKLGVSYEFQQRRDGIPAITSYKLPMAAGIRGMDGSMLFPALEKRDVTMIAANATDSGLASPDFKVLTDDRKVFPAYQASLLVRQDALAEEPMLRPALLELSGKFSVASVRNLTAQIDREHRTAPEVAREFLNSIGLK
jgi:glycine betaine/choline ABC-type transport system substrate-binding protein